MYQENIVPILSWAVKERDAKRKEETKTHTSPKIQKRGVQIKDQNFQSVCPFSPSALNIIPSIRLGFDRVPISCEPLFGLATQVTKVCYTLPTHETPHISLRVGRRRSKFLTMVRIIHLERLESTIGES
jgi:hypothetical protein